MARIGEDFELSFEDEGSPFAPPGSASGRTSAESVWESPFSPAGPLGQAEDEGWMEAGESEEEGWSSEDEESDFEAEEAEDEGWTAEAEDESWSSADGEDEGWSNAEVEDEGWSAEAVETEAEREEREAEELVQEQFETEAQADVGEAEEETGELQVEEAPFDPDAVERYDEAERHDEAEESTFALEAYDEMETVSEQEDFEDLEDTEWEEEDEGPGRADEWPGETESAAMVAAPSGTAVVAKVPLLRRHAGIGPDLILRWNDMPASPRAVDVVVHLHGYSLSSGSRLRLDRDLLPRSGLDWSDPKGADASPGRVRPTLALLPRGHFFGGKSGRAYTFPALMGGGLRQLVDIGLRELASRLGVPNVAMDRLILTAHSGGGAALLALVKPADPHEVHVFDGLYQDGARLIDWMSSRVQRDQAALGGSTGSPDAHMAAQGGALRVLYRAGTARFSGKVAAAIDRLVPPGSPLRRWYRVERTATDHLGIPPTYGWRLLADAAADLPGVPYRPAAKAGSRRELPELESESAASQALRSRIAQVALGEWKVWAEGAKKETDSAMTPVLQQYFRVGVGREVSAEDLRNASWQYQHPWSAVFISYVMRTAGAGGAFAYASAHTAYACAARKARAAGDQSKFWTYRIDEARPEVGDLVCKDRLVKQRCAGTTYESLCSDGNSHCDIVVEVDLARNQIRTIGGNVNQSVDDKTIALGPGGHLPEKARDGCRWLAVIKPPGGVAGSAVSGGGLVGVLATLPGRLADAVRAGAIGLQVALAIVSGQRDEKTLTNMVFYGKHPELPAGYKIPASERHLVQEWLKIRDAVIRPLLGGMGPAPSTRPTTSSPAPPAGTPSRAVGDDRAYKHHSKLGGYSRYGGGRLETVLQDLRRQGKLSITDGDIELLQRISHVETGGCLQALNSWDDVYMSIGFMQWPLAFGKLQRLIARAPEAFKRYGIELDPARRYSIKRSYGTETPIALKGVSQPGELRSLEWAKRFYAAGLDPEIVAREAELALELIGEERKKIEKSLGRSIPHYEQSSALRALIQETNNHRPAWLKDLLKRAVARYTAAGASTADQFLELVRRAIREVYPEKARLAATKRTSDARKIEEAVAKMVRSGEHLIEKTATIHMKGRCAA
jgi:hypothetical protein